MKVCIVNTSKHPLPAYQTEQAAAVDLTANLPQPITLQPMGRVLVPTGIHIALPPQHEAQVRPRSGLAAKHGITVANAPGTIDADYRGEIKVLLVNLGPSAYVIQDGDRIAQLVVAPVLHVIWDEVTQLDETVRGQGGFGHTGA